MATQAEKRWTAELKEILEEEEKAPSLETQIAILHRKAEEARRDNPTGRDYSLAAGRCRWCEKTDKVRHVYEWKRSRKRLLRDAVCPTCKTPLHGTSNELRGPILVHGEPLFREPVTQASIFSTLLRHFNKGKTNGSSSSS